MPNLCIIIRPVDYRWIGHTIVFFFFNPWAPIILSLKKKTYNNYKMNSIIKSLKKKPSVHAQHILTHYLL